MTETEDYDKSAIAAAHAASHQDGGSDEISVEGLAGDLADPQESTWTRVGGKPTTFAPEAHKTSHQDAGSDELSVTALSGLLADPQTPLAHKASHQDAGADEISVTGLSGLLADDQHVLDAEVINLVYPIGSIYISVNATNPGTLFGVGTWASLGPGRTLVGLDAGQSEFDTVEETGGAKTHTLSLPEIPVHAHRMRDHNNRNLWQSDPPGDQIRITGTSTGSNTNILDSGDSGGGGAHNNLQPYIVVYMWKRTA